MEGYQLSTLLWLRWRLTRNQWRRAGHINAVLTVLGLWFGLLLGAVAGVASVVGGALGLADAPPLAMMLVWDGLAGAFLFFWMLGLIIELQRPEAVDLGRLLHLPVSLREVFVLNYVTSLLSLSLAITLPAMLGLTLGLVVRRSLVMVLLVPLIFSFYFAITAWTYCLRGWLATLMLNQRRRRTIVVAVTMFVVLLSQLPNLIMNVWLAHEPAAHKHTPLDMEQTVAAEHAYHVHTLDIVTRAHWFVPLLWLPLGARSLAEGDAWPALLGTAGLFAIGGLGMARAYRSTLGFYQGEATGRAARKPRAARRVRPGRRLLVERSLPMVPEEAAAVALTNFRSLIRAPEIKLTLATNVTVFLILSLGILVRHHAEVPDPARPFIATCAVLMTFLGTLQLLFNVFGIDRQGFRALVLLPSSRREILLGKNLSLAPFAAGVFGINLVLLTVLIRPGFFAVVAAGLEFCGGFLMLSILGNLVSITMPYRISAGSLRPTKTRSLTKFSLGLVQMLMTTALLPLFIPAGLGALSDQLGLVPGALVMVASAAALAAVAAFLYGASLTPLGQLLQRREQRILQVVTEEVE